MQLDRFRGDAVFSSDLAGNQANTREMHTRAQLQRQEEKIGPGKRGGEDKRALRTSLRERIKY